jgi:hypothetical protein
VTRELYDWKQCSDPPALSCGDAGCPVHGWDTDDHDDYDDDDFVDDYR